MSKPVEKSEKLAAWSLLMVGTALGSGLSEQQIRFAMRPKNLSAAIKICKDGDASSRAIAKATGEKQ